MGSHGRPGQLPIASEVKARSINMSANHQTELNIEVRNIHPCFFKCIHMPKLNIYFCTLQFGVIVLYIHFQYKLYMHVLNSNVHV